MTFPLSSVISFEGLFVVCILILVITVLMWRLTRYYRRQALLLHAEREVGNDPYFNNLNLPSQEPTELTKATLLEETTIPSENTKELIIAFFILATESRLFSGQALFNAFEECGLKYGKMKIFNYYGVGDSKLEMPIFSIANMVEPGTFNPAEREQFSSPGIALFMRLPNAFSGRVGLELMLTTAQQLAEKLEGIIQDETGQAIDTLFIKTLHERIYQFEQN